MHLAKGPILLTGCAGFIGFHTTMRLLAEGCTVIGIDNLNEYYDVNLKKARLSQLVGTAGFSFRQISLEDRQAMNQVFSECCPSTVINLAAQAGVRYSVSNPHVYVDSNVVGFLNILEGCRHNRVEHLIYASSSSVYGSNAKMPFSVHDGVDHPLSLYAATKRAGELMAHSYSHLYGLPTTGLRFFTVYGPWGRPDMALFIFTKAILERRPVKVFNYGRMKRDFTYIDDIVEGITRLVSVKPTPAPDWDPMSPDPASSGAPFSLYNIGNNQPVELMRFIAALETALGIEATKEYLPMQAGDVPGTYADVQDLFDVVGFRPTTSIEDGVARFVAWYRSFYNQEGAI